MSTLSDEVEGEDEVEYDDSEESEEPLAVSIQEIENFEKKDRTWRQLLNGEITLSEAERVLRKPPAKGSKGVSKTTESRKKKTVKATS